MWVAAGSGRGLLMRAEPSHFSELVGVIYTSRWLVVLQQEQEQRQHEVMIGVRLGLG